jgi:hypothetical protein
MAEEQKELTFEEKVELFKATAASPKARAEYAQSRAKVINPLIDEQSTIRAIFDPERVPAGAEVRYDIPFDDITCCWTMPQIGGIPQVQVEGAEIYVTTFGLDAAVQYQMDVAEQGRFKVGTLATTLLKNKVIEQEELAGWSLIKAHAAVLGSDQQVAASSLDVAAFNDLVTKADILRRTVTNIYVSPSRFSDLRDWVTTSGLSDMLKDKSYSTAGIKNIWGVNIHKVYNSDLVSNSKAYAFGSREGYTYGVMPVRKQLQTFDNPIAIMEWKIGIMAREIIGFGVLDEKGLIEVTFS